MESRRKPSAISPSCQKPSSSGPRCKTESAMALAREGKSLAVLEDGASIGSGESSRTTALLSSAVDDHYHVIERLHGADGARKTAESHRAAIDQVEQNAIEESIDCQFQRVDEYLYAASGESQDVLEREHRHPQEDVGDPPERRVGAGRRGRREAHGPGGAQAIRMTPGSTGVKRSATRGSWPATTSPPGPARAWIVAKASSISGRLVMTWTGWPVSTLR